MKFKTKTKVLATIVGATMMPVVFPSNMFMTTQVCYAAERRMSLDQALTELHDITMRLLNMENLETREDVVKYLDDNMDIIQDLTYAVLNYARISEENFNAVRQWHRDKFADLKRQQDYERKYNPLFFDYELVANMPVSGGEEYVEYYKKNINPLKSKYNITNNMGYREITSLIDAEISKIPVFLCFKFEEKFKLGSFYRQELVEYSYNDDCEFSNCDVEEIVPIVQILCDMLSQIEYSVNLTEFFDCSRGLPEHYKTSIRVLE